MNVDNLCLHQITIRVWRQSSETRQAALDEEKQNFLEGSFENMLESSSESNRSADKSTAVETLVSFPTSGNFTNKSINN